MKLVQDVWVIMDKNQKAIACGVPRNREMKMFEDCQSRILTYQTEKKAIAGFTVSGFYDRTRKPGEGWQSASYLEETYGKQYTEYSEWAKADRTFYRMPEMKDYLIPVKAKIVIEVPDVDTNND